MGATLYNPDDFYESICEWIAEGKTLRAYCRQEGKPSHTEVYSWLDADKEFALRFARAREKGEEAIAQECLEIADDGSNDWMEEKHGDDDESSWRLNGEHVQRSRLRVDTRLKLLAKWNPKKWGEKVQMGGADDLPPIQAAVTVEFVKPKDSV